ncbi:MAG: DUF2127 domain-containing protein [Terriglobales bacterium]|jgi:uncharacterized membrane protein (DUF2068 family)
MIRDQSLNGSINFQPMPPKLPHPQLGDPKHIRGVRMVATFEFLKGIIVLMAGLGVFSMRHKDIWGVAESFLEFFHVNPYRHYVGVFIDLVSRLSDVRLWKIALVASIYVILRFIEAYGLWYIRPWAEWMAIASGSIYIPFEVADMLRRPDGIRLLIIVVNVAIVLYMLLLRLEAAKKRHTAKHAA